MDVKECKNLTKDLVRDLHAINTLSEDDRRCLKQLITDYFAASYAGYAMNRELNDALEKILVKQGGAPESSVFQLGVKLPAQKAALMNAAYAHGAELDDGNRKAMGHPACSIMPAVLSLAEATNATQEDVLLGLAVGYEAFLRISAAGQPGMCDNAFHSSGIAGALGCAAGCAKLLRMDAEHMEYAIALATTMTSGLLSYTESNPYIKPLNPGKAAETGVFAAMLVKEGVKGPLWSLEGPNGWFVGYARGEVQTQMMFPTEDHLLIHECYYKLYPSCRHTHCSLEAAVNLSSKIDPKEIEKVEVYIYPFAIKFAGNPDPKDRDETKFSIWYTMACAFVNGRYGVADMYPDKAPALVKEIMKKIDVIPDERLEDREKGIRGALVKVYLKDGTTLEETIYVPKGDPEKPLTTEDLQEKLRTCAQGQADEETIAKLIDYIENLGGDEKFVYPFIYE